jgi:hypothetical protein
MFWQASVRSVFCRDRFGAIVGISGLITADSLNWQVAKRKKSGCLDRIIADY